MDGGPAIARAQAVEAGRRSRVVRHARLMPACDDDAAQMRFAVEDALNTADFGDGGRLVLVRRLRLADLPPRASPALVAQAMEQAWRSLAVRAVAALHPSAARAEAVFFASRLEARMAWLAKVAVGQAPQEWFWPAALPELKALPAAAKGAAVESVLEAALREGEAAVVNGLRLWDEAPVVALVRALPARSHSRLLQVLAAPHPSARTTSPAARVAGAPAAQALRAPLAVVARRLAAWMPMAETAASSLVALWLQPVLQRTPSREEVVSAVSHAMEIASQPLPPPDREHHAQQPLARRVELYTPAVSLPAEKEGARTEHRQADAASRPAATRLPEPEAAIERPLAKLASAPASRARPALTVPRRAPQSEWPWLADAAFTRFGGVMLVLNVLDALRFGRRFKGTTVGDAQAFVHALLVHCLDLAGAREDDPQRAWLESSPAAVHPIRLWTLRLRRTLRRHARMDLVDLVRRPAHVSATTTHVDVIFSLDDVDLRLRRLGLDADPGWVPWFGRIVHYHFMEAQLLPPPPEDVHG